MRIFRSSHAPKGQGDLGAPPIVEGAVELGGAGAEAGGLAGEGADGGLAFLAGFGEGLDDGFLVGEELAVVFGGFEGVVAGGVISKRGVALGEGGAEPVDEGVEVADVDVLVVEELGPVSGVFGETIEDCLKFVAGGFGGGAGGGGGG